MKMDGLFSGTQKTWRLSLLARGASVHIVDKLGFVVLHVAGHEGYSGSVISALYEAGADPTLRTKKKFQTPADLARAQGHQETAVLLDMLADEYRSSRGTEEVKVVFSADGGPPLTLNGPDALLDKAREMMQHEKYRTVDEKGRPGLNVAGVLKTLQSASLDLKMQMKALKEERESKDEKQTASPYTCVNCESRTNRRCSGCKSTYFCSKKCERAARHLCCG